MAEQVIRVLVVDDHTIVRKALVSLLSVPRFNIEIVGEAADGVEAIELLEETAPDVVLLDLVMPRQQGPEVTRKIKQQYPDIRVLVLTSFNEDDLIISAIHAGAEGYLPKECSPEELIHAIRTVYLGRFSLPAEMARKVFFSSEDVEISEPGRLTPREFDVLKYLSTGLSNQDIADKMQLSPLTVRSHVRNIMKKLGLKNRTQAALYAVQKGLIT